MTAPLIAGCFWILAGTITALLPMRRQYVPGITLLALAPVLLIWIGWVHGALWALLGLAAFLSMFRNPLVYFWRRWRGLPVSRPEERE
jgi:Protein of unknown function (DUF2484)